MMADKFYVFKQQGKVRTHTSYTYYIESIIIKTINQNKFNNFEIFMNVGV